MGAMFDYIEITKYLSDGYYDDSRIEYGRLNNDISIVKVNYNARNRILTVRGSLPYFEQGHNFYFDLQGAKRAIHRIGELLDVNLFDAEVKVVEYGVVVCPKFKINDFIRTHLGTRTYRRNIYEDRGLKYIKKNKSYSLKFYSLWANIGDTINKVSSEVRAMLKHTNYRRGNNPMRYEIHGNIQKILDCGRVTVAELLTAEFEDQLKNVLLEKYRELEKSELLILEEEKTDSWTLTLILLSQYNANYKEDIIGMIEKTNDDIQSRSQQKKRFRDKLEKIQCQSCSYSIESLIMECV